MCKEHGPRCIIFLDGWYLGRGRGDMGGGDFKKLHPKEAKHSYNLYLFSIHRGEVKK